jgi:hypothetical protein
MINAEELELIDATTNIAQEGYRDFTRVTPK